MPKPGHACQGRRPPAPPGVGVSWVVLDRRQFLIGATAGGVLACTRGPAIRTRGPTVTHGVQAGDVQTDRALVWARCDQPARMIVEWSTTPTFARVRRVAGPVVGPDTDFTATVALTGLPPGQTIAYRVRFEREAARGASAWEVGRFAMPRADGFRFAWTGDTCGQGFGRNPEWGGLRGYAAIRASAPAFLLHAGDLIYADNPILPEQPTLDGRIWRNISNERVARVAQELDDFRARFAYNLEDEHVRALAAEVPILAQWDDHETRNNWWPGQQLDDPRYTERDASTLAARALRATREWTPIGGPTIHRVITYGPLADVFVLDLRSFRTPNDANRGDAGAMLGAAQARWLVEALSRSTARWKVIACDQPLALVIGDGPGDARQEGFANGDGPPLGRERELAAVLAELHAARDHQRRVADGRRPLRRRAPLRSGARDRRHVRPVLGVHRRADPRRHVRPQPARSDVRAGDQISVGAAAGHRQPRAVGRPAVVRHDRRHPRRAPGLAARDRRQAALRARPPARRLSSPRAVA